MYLLTIIIGVVLSSSEIDELLIKWEKSIERSSYESQKIFEEIVIKLDSIPNSSKSRFFRLYGQYILYGLEYNEEIDYARALYYFKTSAELGNTKALFYMSLMTYFQLDGSLNIAKNIENQFLEQNYPKLYQYTSDKYKTVSQIDLYFSAIQGYHQASVSMGYHYYRGMGGVQRNCSNAALFYLPVLEEFSKSSYFGKHVYDSRKIAQVRYDSDFYQSHELDIFEHASIFENLKTITHDTIIEVKLLATSYYYGLNGLSRDLVKAYNLYNQLYQQMNDIESGIKVAQMNLENLGIKIPDYGLAIDILTKIKTKNQEHQGKIFNSLGYIYFKGLGASQDIIKAQEYFRKSAELNNPDGQFNLGSLYMLPTTLQRERNQKKGTQLIELAASQGHSLAQYSLALLLLDGVELFYSCDIAASLMQSAISRGPWAESITIAHYLYQQQRYPQAFIRFLEAGYSGLWVGSLNAQSIAQEKQSFYFNENHFSTVQQRLDIDIIYNYFGHQNGFDYLYEDYLNLINKTQLINLLNLPYEQLNGVTQRRLLQLCKLEKDSICFMKLGEYYYEGKYETSDYQLAFGFYKQALSGNLIESMKAHVYFNLGMMYALGQGVQINRTKSVEIFELSFSNYSLIPGLPIHIQVQITDYFLNLYKQILDVGIEEYFNVNFLTLIINIMNEIENQFIQLCFNKIFINIMLVISMIFVYGVFLRQINQPK